MKAGGPAYERYVLDKGKLQAGLLDNPDQAASAGVVLIVSYPRIEGATRTSCKGMGYYGIRPIGYHDWFVRIILERLVSLNKITYTYLEWFH